jgi:hypothetical protein
MPKYGDPKYWDQRYSEQAGKMFDWYTFIHRLEDYESLKGIVKELCPSNEAKILMVGCGNAGTLVI